MASAADALSASRPGTALSRPGTALSRPGTAQSSRCSGTRASTTLRRRVLESATLGEWDKVRHAVDVQGCNVNVQDEETGFSLVHWAAYQGNEAELRWLAEHGAFLRLKDRSGRTPLAGAKGETGAVLLELAYSPLERVVYTPGPPSIQRLEHELAGLDGEALNEPLCDENGACLAAVLAGLCSEQATLALLQWLLDRGADLDKLDEEGNGLLHMIDYSLGFNVIEPLLVWALHDASLQHVDHRNFDSDTPALLCAYNSPTGEDALRGLQLMDAAGSTLTRANRKGMNVAMALARYQGAGPWLGWCQSVARIDPKALDTKNRSIADHLQLFGVESDDDEQ
eukprot:TRINITY_DN48018_c0_g1_i1.p1 TRINITY_DN48018_c0_g1~~TRINITY_DN48018_c0_g1_i1.p1  ORF type:complete len:355 (-),score=65.51 TRINITY_DN48018_c0_g1_i1:322-1341(-)